MYKLELKSAEMIYGCVYENGKTYVIPPVGQPNKFNGDKLLWIIDIQNKRFSKVTTDGVYLVAKKKSGVFIDFAEPFDRTDFGGLPLCDFCGNKFSFNFNDDSLFETTLSRFYWESILNECAERTVMRKKKRLREGYVLSTLKIDFYGGTYPAVDHEFHIRGRLAMGDKFDTEVVKRMIELQLRVMRTDWRGQFRNLLSLQPNGRREYRIYRRSQNKKTKAIMFLVTANLEIVEEIYNYYCLTKDIEFLKSNIETVEAGLRYVQNFIDENGRLWGDVYYEDQVMKDGANAQAQAFAINIFSIMAKIEDILSCNEKAKSYREISKKMTENYVLPVPDGYWDREKERYIDWIDRKGIVHDHVHLLSNALSVSFGLNDSERDKKVNKTISEYDNIFQKFPSFVSAKIEDYTDDEIGTGGPYDLCAAGRYWCHDAKYRKRLGDGEILKNQLIKVANQAKIDDYKMGERYDMNYVYYNSGKDGEKNWHGSPLYYEYPNVFADVLVHDYLGFSGDEKCDVSLCPCLADYGAAEMESYSVRYEYSEKSFSVTNLKSDDLTVRVDLSKLFGKCVYNEKEFKNGSVITVNGGETAVFNSK